MHYHVFNMYDHINDSWHQITVEIVDGDDIPVVRMDGYNVPMSHPIFTTATMFAADFNDHFAGLEDKYEGLA